MNVHQAVDKWLRRELTMLEVLAITGHSIEEAHRKYAEIEADLEQCRLTDPRDIELQELEGLAYRLYGDLLHEGPGYRDQVLEGLRRRQRQNLVAFGARFKGKLHGQNVVPFRPSTH
jgi:hypothetical protein